MADPNNTDGAPPREVHVEPKKTNWLAWILLGLGLLALLLALSRCNRGETTVVDNNTTAMTNDTTTNDTATNGIAPVTAPLPIEKVKLPNGQTVDLEPNTLNYELQRFLGSSDATPRTFTFDKLNFDSGKAGLRADDQNVVNGLGQILSAYPKAMVTLVGYTDTQGAGATNVKLGEERAMAVAKALEAKGIAAGRIKTQSGGESKPVATNANDTGRFDNRRTELTVTAK